MFGVEEQILEANGTLQQHFISLFLAAFRIQQEIFFSHHCPWPFKPASTSFLYIFKPFVGCNFSVQKSHLSNFLNLETPSKWAGTFNNGDVSNTPPPTGLVQVCPLRYPRQWRWPGEDHMASGDLVSPPRVSGLLGSVVICRGRMKGWRLLWTLCHQPHHRLSLPYQITAGVQAKLHFMGSWESQFHWARNVVEYFQPFSASTGNTDTETSMKGLRCHNSSPYCVTFTWLSKLQLITVSMLDTDPGFWSSSALLLQILSTVTFCLPSHLCCIAKMLPGSERSSGSPSITPNTDGIVAVFHSPQTFGVSQSCWWISARWRSSERPLG